MGTNSTMNNIATWTVSSPRWVSMPMIIRILFKVDVSGTLIFMDIISSAVVVLAGSVIAMVCDGDIRCKLRPHFEGVVSTT
jgi:hypothetical protein